MKKFLRLIIVVGLLLGSMTAQAQRSYKYRVYFTDKLQTEFSLDHPEMYLSDRALQRRKRQGISIDSTDLPVCRQYIDALQKLGTTCVLTSKWNNTAVMLMTDETMANRFIEFPFVRSVRKVWEKPDTIFAETRDRKELVTNKQIQ